MGNCCQKPKDRPARPGEPGNFNKGDKIQNVEPDQNELRNVFRQFDVDGDGFIEEHELRSVMKNMGQNPTNEEIKAMFKAADNNGDGKISFEEFCLISKANPMTLSLKTVFAELDADGDGEITKEELLAAFQRMGHALNDQEAEQICRQADANRDGKLNFEEFVRMMCHKKM